MLRNIARLNIFFLLLCTSYSQTIDDYSAKVPMGRETYKCDFCMCSLGASPLDFSGTGIRIDPRYLQMNRVVSGGRITENSDGRYEKHFSLQVSGIYSFGKKMTGKKFSLIGIFPYAVREGRESSDEPVSHTSGLGDIIIFGRYLALERYSSKGTLLLSVQSGIKFPTGKSDEKNENGELIDAHFQVGTGSTDFLLGSNFLYSYKRFALSTNLLFGIKTTGSTGYRFGNNLNYDIISRSKVYQGGSGEDMLFAAAGFRGELRGKEKQDGLVIENTGGNTTYLAAGFSFFFTPFFTVEAMYQHPVYYNLNGTQEAESFRLTSGIQLIF